MSQWKYKTKTVDPSVAEGYQGFVYLITNLKTGRKYVGKKYFWTTKVRSVNKKKKKVKVQSDWPNYWGSSVELLADVEKYGEENFSREILHLAVSKGDCSYLEAKEQFARNVLLDESYYNQFIGAKIHARHLKLTNEEVHV